MTLAFNGLVEPSTSNMTLDLSGRITGIRKREEKLHRANFSCARTRLLSPITGHIVWQPIVSASGSIAHAITTANGNNFQSTTAADFGACVDACATTTSCIAIDYRRATLACTLLSNVNAGMIQPYSIFDRAILVGG